MAKPVNYTTEMTARAVELYTSVADGTETERTAMVEQIADELEKSPRSIRSKLSREGVYIAKKPVSKVSGEAPAKKIELANRLVAITGANADAENVAKMNKLDIIAFINAFETRD